jgi:hypothetical protein
MKKQLLLFFWLFAAVAAFSQPVLYLGSVNGWQGGTVALDVGLSAGAAHYAGFNATLQLPAGFQFLRVLNGPLLSGGGFIIAQQPSVVQGTNQLSILAYSGTNTFTGNGVLLSILLQISNTAPLGVQPVLFMQNNTNSSLNAHALSSQNGQVSVQHSVSPGAVQVFNRNAYSGSNGFSDLQAIAFGINPLDPTSKPAPQIIFGPNGPLIVFPTSADRAFQYRVIYSDQLALPLNAWNVLYDNINGTGGFVTNSLNLTNQEFFQVIVEVAQ